MISFRRGYPVHCSPRPPHCHLHRGADSARRRHRSRTAPVRPHLAPVPHHTGQGRPRCELHPCGHRGAQADLCADRGRARLPPGPSARRDRAPDPGVDHPSRPHSADGPHDRATTITFLLRDRDSRFTSAFDAVFAADGIRILTSPPAAPRANAVCERMIASPAPRTLRQGPGRQRTSPAPDPHDLPAPRQYRAATPDANATRPGPGRNPAPACDQPRRPPGGPQTDPRRTHQRVPDRSMIESSIVKPQVKPRILYSSPTRSSLQVREGEPPL